MEDFEVSDDARRRIDSTVVRQLAFEVKKIAPGISLEDAEMLAEVIMESIGASDKALDGAKVRAALKRRDRSSEKADQLARLIGL